MRITFAVAVVVLVTAPTLHAGDQGKSGKHKNAKATTAVASDHEKTSTAVSVSVSWGTHDLDLVRRHYAPRYRSLPPGLQKQVRAHRSAAAWMAEEDGAVSGVARA